MLLFSVLSCSTAIHSSPSPTVARLPDLDAYVSAQRTQERLPALYVAVYYQGRCYGAVAGLQRGEGGPKAGLGDKFRIGSVTKPMTATLVMLLASQGKLDLKASPKTYLPALRERMDEGYGEVTLLHLLCHAAGLPNPGTTNARQKTGEGAETFARRARAEDAIDYFSAPPVIPIGHYAYSNNGYTALGAIIEATTGLSYERAMSDLLFKPLGMSNSGVGMPATAQAPNQPCYYPVKDGKEQAPLEPTPKNEQHPSAAPQGGVYTTVEDACTFMRAHVLWWNGQPGLLRSDVARVYRSFPFGGTRSPVWETWQEGRFGTAITHNGQNSDGRGAWDCTQMRIVPGAQFGVFIATTTGEKMTAIHRMANEVQAYFLGKP